MTYVGKDWAVILDAAVRYLLNTNERSARLQHEQFGWRRSNSVKSPRGSEIGRPMLIIIVADNASSLFGGEAFIPLNYFRFLLARNVDVRLVVHARNKGELIKRFPNDQERLYFVEDTWLHKTLFHFGQDL